MTTPIEDDVVQVPGQLELFDGPSPAKQSSDRRRVERQRAAVARGVHPLTGGRARPELGTCGTCVHRVLVGGHAKAYPKCELGPRSSGAATDVRRWWPACSRWGAAS